MLVDIQQEAYTADTGKELSYDRAVDEVVADACADMLKNTNAVEDLVAKNPSLAEKIRQFIKRWINKLKEAYNGINTSTYEMSELEDALADFSEIQRLWDNALRAVKSDETSAQKETPAEDGGVKYSLRPGAEKDVDRALSDKSYRDDVCLTESSPSVIVCQKGVRNLPMLMKASHIRENIYTEQEAEELGLKVDKYINYHGLGKELFLKIIDGLDDVKLAYRGTKNASDTSRRENYFLLISQYNDAQGNTVNVPVYIDEKGQYNRVFIDTNKIATVFGRNDFYAYIQKEIQNGNLVRIKNKSIQTSERTALIAGGYSKNASDIKIAQNESDVNTYSIS